MSDQTNILRNQPLSDRDWSHVRPLFIRKNTWRHRMWARINGLHIIDEFDPEEQWANYNAAQRAWARWNAL